MRFGPKVAFDGPGLWFHDHDGHPLFGILGEDAALLAKEASGALCLSVMRPRIGLERIELCEDDIRQIRDLSATIDHALSAQDE